MKLNRLIDVFIKRVISINTINDYRNGCVTIEELDEKIKCNKNSTILDVRTLMEYNEGHISGAILIPYNEILIKANQILKDKNQEIIVYCLNGGRSIKAVKTLEKIGYTNVYSLNGGILEWTYRFRKK
jgi:Rhodanese-related sulfurtransferase